ncbi:hypothetical protein BS47DRAFT_1401980 [Hydnum rufescens UP504]|uniref:Uncharacterized protein n=1 Tax=Hydnum rufescens UP504 TaxID=1448309 RepID=A0A9P6ADU1_9AGAM|nr:hypothetical protein BS47DRAFT_1401980 [Hydnum rufescens UP504]
MPSSPFRIRAESLTGSDISDSLKRTRASNRTKAPAKHKAVALPPGEVEPQEGGEHVEEDEEDELVEDEGRVEEERVERVEGKLMNDAAPTQKKVRIVAPKRQVLSAEGPNAEKRDIFDRRLRPNTTPLVSLPSPPSEIPKPPKRPKTYGTGAAGGSSQSNGPILCLPQNHEVEEMGSLGEMEGQSHEILLRDLQPRPLSLASPNPDTASTKMGPNVESSGLCTQQTSKASLLRATMSEELDDVEHILMESEMEETPAGSPSALGAGLGLSDEEGEPGALLGIGASGLEGNGGPLPGTGPEEREAPNAEGSSALPETVAFLKASKDKNVRRRLEKEQAALSKLPALKVLTTSMPSEEHITMPVEAQGPTDSPVEQVVPAATVLQGPSSTLTKSQTVQLRRELWAVMEKTAKEKAESLDVQPSTVFKLLGELFSAQSYRENIWNSFQSVYKAEHPEVKDVGTIKAAYEAEVKEVGDRGEFEFRKWRIGLKEQAERVKVDQMASKLDSNTRAKVIREKGMELSETAHVTSNLHDVEIFGLVLCRDAIDLNGAAAATIFSSSLETSDILRRHIWTDDIRRKIMADLYQVHTQQHNSLSEDPLETWIRLKTSINTAQGPSGAQQVLRTYMSRAWMNVINQGLGREDTKAAFENLGKRMYTGWGKPMFYMKNFPANVRLTRMESLTNEERWAILQACTVGLLEKDGDEVKVVPNSRVQIMQYRVHKEMTKTLWLEGFGDTALILSTDKKAVLTVSEVKKFQDELAAFKKSQKGKGKAKEPATPTVYISKNKSGQSSRQGATHSEGDEGPETEEE